MLYCIMSENISMTRIVDLPEDSRMGPIGGDQGFSNTYMPIDVHPNPYGMPPPPPGGILPPQHTQQRAQIPEEINQRLPQRDIPMNVSQHIQDEYIQPNYIPPPPKVTKDYIQEYQESNDRKIREYEEQKMREKQREHWLDEFQVPIFVGLLYFVFQLPIINTMIFKRFAFLAITRDDGNFNFLGLTLKCILFAITFYSLQRTIHIISSL